MSGDLGVSHESRGETSPVRPDALAAVSEAVTTFLEQENWNQALAVLLRCALQLTESEYGFIGVLVEPPALRVLAHEGIRWHETINRAFFDEARAAYERNGYLEFSSFQNLFGAAITSGAVVVSDNPIGDPRSGGLPPGHPPMHSFLGVPVYRGSEIVGLIAVANRRGGYGGAEQAGIAALVRQTALLCDNYRRRQRERLLQEQHRQAIDALQLSEQRYRLVCEVTSDFAYSVRIEPDGTRVFEWVTEAMSRVLGFSLEEINASGGARTAVHPDDLPAFTAHVARQLRGESSLCEFRVVSKDGTVRWLEDSAHPVWDAGQGRTIRVIGGARDISERRAAEDAMRRYTRRLQIVSEIQRAILAAETAETIAHATLSSLRSLVPATRAVVALFDLERGVAKVLAAEVLTGPPTAAGMEVRLDDLGISEISGGEIQIIDDLGVIAEPPRVFRRLKETGVRCIVRVPLLVQGQLVGSLNLGTEQPAAFSAEHLAIAREIADPLAVAIRQASLRDEIRNANLALEQRVRDRTAQLEAANQELEAFSYSVSHDLRAPLRRMSAFAQALREDFTDRLDPGAAHYVERIQVGTEQMGALIDDLLNLSRVATLDLHRESVDVSALVRRIASELAEREPARALDLEIAEPMMAHADNRLLQVVLENLLGNAWKYTRKRPRARIEVGVTQGVLDGGDHSSDGRSADRFTMPNAEVFFVRDNGAGFDMALRDRLFGAFQRLHTTAEFEGTGIGLATVRRIIHRHGGQVWAEGAVEQGATFYFTLGLGRGA